MITFGNRSVASKVGLHPDLIKVLDRAAEIATTAQDFTVLEGVRGHEQMAINYGKGRTVAECKAKGLDPRYAKPNDKKVTWLNNPYASNHAVGADGYGHAFDVAPYPLNWNDERSFKDLSVVIKQAADDMGVAIVWGGDWKTTKDLPHYELAA